jgi:fumarylacetoacetate (FAA) hydrolase
MKIICIGKNYTDLLAAEGAPTPTEMVLFTKPDTAVHNTELPYYIPEFTTDLLYEAEVVLKINQNGKAIAPRFAHKYYEEITVGLDFTARDVLARLQQAGLSWERGKAFDGSAVIGTFLPKQTLGDLCALPFSLQKNGATVQNGNTQRMLWGFDAIVSEVSHYFTLRKGDLIFTGTPAGAAPVSAGDILEGFLGNISVFKLKIKG